MSVDPSNESFMMFGTDCEFKGLSHFTIEGFKPFYNRNKQRLN